MPTSDGPSPFRAARATSLLRQPLAVLTSFFAGLALTTLLLQLAVPGSIISPLWPPAALLLYLGLRHGVSRLGIASAGATLAFVWHGWPWLAAMLMGLAMGWAAWSAVMLIQGFERRGRTLARTAGQFRLVLIALASGLLSAPLALVGALLAGRLGPAPEVGALTWTLGIATGTLIFLPLLHGWRPAQTLFAPLGKKLEATIFLVLLLTVAYIAFGSTWRWSFAYLPIPFIIWAAYRFDVATIVWSTALICLLATAGTMRGTGPFSHVELNTALLELSVYVSVIGILGLTLTNLLQQWAAAEGHLKAERDLLEQRVLARTEALHKELTERRNVERRLAEAQRLAQTGSWELDVQTGEITWSEQLYRIFGHQDGTLHGAPLEYVNRMPQADWARFETLLERSCETGEPFSIEHKVLLPDGTIRVVEAKGRAERGRDGRVRRVAGTAQDVTEARLAQRRLDEAQERYRRVVEISPDAILVQQQGLVAYVNPACCSLLGAAHEAVLQGRPLIDFLVLERRSRTAPPLDQLQTGALTQADCQLKRLDGTIIDVEVRSSQFSHQGRFAVLHVMRDITERKRNAEQLAYLAHYDALTGLPNRALFQQKLEHAINVAERPGRTLELLFLDIDRFKQINDTLGHDAGDAVLKETAHRLHACLRESDTVARLAGDEFVVLVENVKETQRGATIAEKILAAFSPPFSVAGTTIHVGTSIGIAASPHDAREPALLLKHADSAMYRAKQQGRNRYCYYSPQLDAETAVRRTLEHSLRHALERGELTLHYQPSFDIASGRMIGMEALLRWTHPQLGVVKPQRFLALAEETGLMDAIGDWILHQACRQALEWNDDGMRVAVNLSAQQFNDMHLGQRLQAVLAETGLAPDKLEIEIPEEALSGHEEQAQRSLEALHALGVGLTIDHFGFGHASLAQLAASRAGTVKIGPALIRNLPGDASGVALARVIVHVAHSLGWRVVAQGAETRQQVDFLRTLSCDSVQGHYFGEAMPAAVLRERMQDQASLLH